VSRPYNLRLIFLACKSIINTGGKGILVQFCDCSRSVIIMRSSLICLIRYRLAKYRYSRNAPLAHQKFRHAPGLSARTITQAVSSELPGFCC